MDDINFNQTLMNIKMTVCTIAATMLAVSALAAGTNLETLKSSYATQTVKIDVDANTTLAKLNAAYGRSLDKAIAALRAKGDPEPVMTASAEKVRFEKEKTVPNPPDEKLPKMVQAVQSKYHEAVANAETERDRRRASLMEKYIKALDRLMREQTVAGQMDMAMEIKAEKERVEFILADDLHQSKTQDGVTSGFKDKPGLLVHFDFEKTEGNAVTDKSENSNNGTIHGGRILTDDVRGNVFEAVGSRGAFVSHPKLTFPRDHAWSLTVWHKLSTQNRQQWLRFAGTKDKGPSGGWWMYHPGLCWYQDYNKKGNRYYGLWDSQVTAGVDFLFSEWAHLAIVSRPSLGDDVRITFYLNGMQRGKATEVKWSPRVKSVTFDMVGTSFGTDRSFGLIDDYMVWDKALTGDEVRRVFNAQR